ncbi:uncharacterized protein LOC143850138 [Tasmannia lanceolata]|uniref:uncharacterized protein LOC143850138 n=1 Tax=Tasmannia lanceolata TaxID=3420 RepID=UPI004062F776
MSAPYTAGRGRSRESQDLIMIEHHYWVDIFNAAIDSQLQELNSRFNEQPTERLSATGKSAIYYLIDRLIRLVLTFPVSTATTKRAFSAMKLVKTRLRNKMEEEFLADCLVFYIEKEIAKSFSTEMIIDEFYSMKSRRAQLK